MSCYVSKTPPHPTTPKGSSLPPHSAPLKETKGQGGALRDALVHGAQVLHTLRQQRGAKLACFPEKFVARCIQCVVGVDAGRAVQVLGLAVGGKKLNCGRVHLHDGGRARVPVKGGKKRGDQCHDEMRPKRQSLPRNKTRPRD